MSERILSYSKCSNFRLTGDIDRMLSVVAREPSGAEPTEMRTEDSLHTWRWVVTLVLRNVHRSRHKTPPRLYYIYTQTPSEQYNRYSEKLLMHAWAV